MKKQYLLLFTLILFIFTNVYAQNQQFLPGIIIEFIDNDPNQMILPNPFMIFVQHGVAINHPVPGFVKVALPTNNDYFGVPGCYIECYSSYEQSGIYNVGYNTYVNGLVRVLGHYENKICVPWGYHNINISKVSFFNQLCENKLRSCVYNDCWADGNTGGLLGMKKS